VLGTVPIVAGAVDFQRAEQLGGFVQMVIVAVDGGSVGELTVRGGF
jgi:hypothetical protein